MRYFYLSLGLLCCGLGMVGIFVPVLPTTPLLLLALFCFSRSSRRFYNWLTHTEMYHTYLDEFVRTGQMKRREKHRIMAVATSMMVLAVILVDVTAARLGILALLMIFWYVFLFRIKTAEE